MKESRSDRILAKTNCMIRGNGFTPRPVPTGR